MALKEQVLEIFAQNSGQNISGARIARQLGVTRAAIWKTVESLKQEGYEIDAAPKLGYRFSPKNDRLSAAVIKPYLRPDTPFSQLLVYEQLESTNDEARRLAKHQPGQTFVVLAEEQTHGRGRRGRGFYSPPGCGVYLSAVLPSAKLPAQQLTTAAAVAVCRAIERVAEVQPQIKWVNDLYLDGKKICGILTEATVDFETGQIGDLVLGIGVNAFAPSSGVPEELRNKVGFLGEHKSFLRSRLAGEILNELQQVLWLSDISPLLEEYRRRSLVLGKKVEITAEGERYGAIVLDLDQKARLVVRDDAGKIRTVAAGEVRLV